MALSSIPVPPDQKRDARALEFVDSVGSWPLFTLRQQWGSFEPGTVFRRAPSPKGGGTWYLVNAVACQCPDYADWGHVCKHVRAVIIWEQQQAAFDAEVERVQGPAPKKRLSYADLFPACKGCDDLADGRDGYCDRCASDRAWQARRDAFASIPAFTLNPLAE
jgi:hypothetical protein